MILFSPLSRPISGECDCSHVPPIQRTRDALFRSWIVPGSKTVWSRSRILPLTTKNESNLLRSLPDLRTFCRDEGHGHFTSQQYQDKVRGPNSDTVSHALIPTSCTSYMYVVTCKLLAVFAVFWFVVVVSVLSCFGSSRRVECVCFTCGSSYT